MSRLIRSLLSTWVSRGVRRVAIVVGLALIATTGPVQFPTAVQPAVLQEELAAAQTPRPPSPSPATPAVSYLDRIDEDEPIRHYRLDETMGTTAHDRSTSQEHGTYGTGVALGSHGALLGDSNTAVTRTGGHLLTASAHNLPTGNEDRTVEFWLKTTSWFYSSEALRWGGGTGDDFRIAVRDVGEVSVWSGSQHQTLNFGKPISDNQWHQIAITTQGNTVSFYLDGDMGGTRQLSLNTSGLDQLVFGSAITGDYDEDHRILTMLDPNQQGSSNPTPVTNEYDSVTGKVTAQTDQLGHRTTFAYNPDGSVLITDPNGNKTLDRYENHLRTSVTTGYATPQAVTTKFTYDPRFASVTSTHTSSPGEETQTTTYASYDDNGDLRSVTDAMGRVSTYAYNQFGNVVSETLPNPGTNGPPTITTTYTYDSHGNLLTTSRPLFTGSSESTQTVTLERHDTARPYLVTASRDTANKTTTYEYNATGELTKETSPEGRITTYTYDVLGRVITSTSPKGNAPGGNPTAHTTTITYDAADRILTSITPNGTETLTTAYTYDPNGNTLTVTDADGRTTTNTFDKAGRHTVVTHHDGSTFTNTYHDNNWLHQQLDSAGKATTYTYDALGQLTKTTDPLGRETTFIYDNVLGVPKSSTDGKGQTTYFSYEKSGALKKVTYGSTTTPEVTNTYGRAGQRTSITDGSGTQTFTYDSNGQLTSHTNGKQETVAYSYNTRGNVTELIYPNNRTVTRAFDDDGLLTSITDWENRTTTYDYDQNGNLIETTYPNGVVGAVTTSDAGFANGISYKKNNTDLGSFSYTRSTGGELLSETSTGLGQGTPRSYTYTQNGQLSSDTGSAFTYDQAKNLTQLRGATRTFDVARQLTTSTANGTTTTYTHDANGNRTSTQLGTTTTQTYSYDQANRLKEAGNTTYSYDGLGLRTKKAKPTGDQDFTYNIAEGLPLVLSDGTHDYLYGPSGEILAQYVGTNVHYLHGDQLGSTRLITDENANLTATYQYDAFGTTTQHSGTETPFQYAGEYQDEETGFIYLRARYYDPQTATFLTRDPIEHTTRDPYSYADNDPTNATDPSGLVCVTFLHKNCVSFAKGSKTGANIKRGATAVAISAGAVATGGVIAHVAAGGTVASSMPTLSLAARTAAVGGQRVASWGASQAARASNWCSTRSLSGRPWFNERGAIQKPGRIPSRKHHDKQYRDAVREAEKSLKKKLSSDQKDRLHREISKQGYDYHEIVQIAKDMFG